MIHLIRKKKTITSIGDADPYPKFRNQNLDFNKHPYLILAWCKCIEIELSEMCQYIWNHVNWRSLLNIDDVIFNKENEILIFR